jgi:hypothetical protein
LGIAAAMRVEGPVSFRKMVKTMANATPYKKGRNVIWWQAGVFGYTVPYLPGSNLKYPSLGIASACGLVQSFPSHKATAEILRNFDVSGALPV